MDSHSPGMGLSSGAEWSESPAYKSTGSPLHSSPSSSLTDHSHESAIDYHQNHHHSHHHHQFDVHQMHETKRSFSLCALSLSNSSEADLSSGYFERRSYRPFRSNEEYLVAMREDLAEWLNTIYAGLELNADNFLSQLETGVTLCRHANSVLNKIRDWRDADRRSPFKFRLSELDLDRDVVFRASAQPNTFHARDNVANFINWCRRIRIHECLLFETEDLVSRKNEKSFVLCLLEVARYGAKFGVLAPTLVQFEQEIDRELAKEEDNFSRGDCESESVDSGVATPEQQPEGLLSDEEPELLLPYGPQPQICNNDLESLHEKVVKLLSKCACPVQFHLEHLSEGKYRIGDTKTLIFVRILRNHVMVRVGGGWDTLEHYLEKHDPCRCGRLAQRSFGSLAGRTSSTNGSIMRATSGVSVKHDRHEFSPCGSHSMDHRSQVQLQPSPAPNRSSHNSVNSSPIPSRRSITTSGSPNSCESLTSSPSEVASSLASSQNSIASNASSSGAATQPKPTKLDRNNNNLRNNQRRSTIGNCKRKVESKIPKLGKPPSGAQQSAAGSSPGVRSSPAAACSAAGLLPSKNRSTSVLSLLPSQQQQQCNSPLRAGSRIPSLSSALNRSSTHNLSQPASLSTPSRLRPATPDGASLPLSSRQKQRSTMELRTPTPPIYQSPFSTASLNRRQMLSTARKSMVTPPPPPVAQQSTSGGSSPGTGSSAPRRLTVSIRQSLPSSPVMSRRELSRRSPSLTVVPVELSQQLERHHSGCSSLGDTSSSSTGSSSFSSLTTAVPTADFRSGSARIQPPSPQRGKQQQLPLNQPKNSALVNVSSWLERNPLTSP